MVFIASVQFLILIWKYFLSTAAFFIVLQLLNFDKRKSATTCLQKRLISIEFLTLAHFKLMTWRFLYRLFESTFCNRTPDTFEIRQYLPIQEGMVKRASELVCRTQSNNNTLRLRRTGAAHTGDETSGQRSIIHLCNWAGSFRFLVTWPSVYAGHVCAVAMCATEMPGPLCIFISFAPLISIAWRPPPGSASPRVIECACCIIHSPLFIFGLLRLPAAAASRRCMLPLTSLWHLPRGCEKVVREMRFWTAIWVIAGNAGTLVARSSPLCAGFCVVRIHHKSEFEILHGMRTTKNCPGLQNTRLRWFCHFFFANWTYPRVPRPFSTRRPWMIFFKFEFDFP